MYSRYACFCDGSLCYSHLRIVATIANKIAIIIDCLAKQNLLKLASQNSRLRFTTVETMSVIILWLVT
jgi:hypothetical protein